MKLLEEDIKNVNRNWHIKTYNSLVESRRSRGIRKKSGDGYNKHHIIPKCMGGKDEEDNFVLLTFREHIIAHHLLHRIFPESSELSYAYLRMIQSSKSDRKENTYKEINGKRISYNTRELEKLKLNSIEYLRKINTGRKLSPEQIEKIRKAKTGVKYSEEVKKKLSEMRIGHEVRESTREKISVARVGMEFTKDHKKNISESHKGKKLSEETKKKVSDNSVTKRKILGPNGEIYDSVRNCAKALNITIGAMYHKLNHHPEEGYKYESERNYREAVSRKVLDTNTGIKYDSLNQCGKALSRDPKTIKNWIEKHPEKGFKYID